MTFLDPVCTTDCPLIAQEFRQTGQLLGAQDKNVELVAIVANPTYRSTAFTRAFDRQEGLTTVPNWRYLTGSLSQLSAVWRQYGVTVENLPAGAMSAHNDLAVVIDPAGQHPRGGGRRPGPRHQQHPVLVLRAAQPVRPPGAGPLVIRGLAQGRGPASGPSAWRSCAGLVAACGSQRAAVTSPAPPPVTAPLSTSLVTAQGTWAIAVMGGSAAADNNFWQLFVRPAGASRWSLVTPQGVADNGGLVAAGGARSLTVGFRPSQNLAFSPLATSTDAGQNWTPGLLDAGLADTPGAIAVGPSGRTLALLQDGTIEAAPTASAAAAGQWTRLTTLKALAASAPGRACGLAGVNAVSFGPDKYPMAAGSCARPGVAGVFADAGGTWRSAGPALPASRRGPGAGARAGRRRGRRRGAAGRREQPARRVVERDALDGIRSGRGGRPCARSGFGPGGSAWLLLGRRAGGDHRRRRAARGRRCRPCRPGTATLAPRAP